MEDRRRRRIAFENVGKEMLRYHHNSDDVKVGITELQETLEVPVQIGISIQQVAQLTRSENGQKIFEEFWQEEEEGRRRRRRRTGLCCKLGQMGCAVERLSRFGKKMSRHKSENTTAEQKTGNIFKMRSKVSSKCKAEQVKDFRTKSKKK